MPERNPPRGKKLPEPTDVNREPLSASVQVGQIFRYLGQESKHLSSGGLFRIKEVDDERQLVKIMTAEEEIRADMERRSPQTFIVSKAQWDALPKQLDVGQEVSEEQ